MDNFDTPVKLIICWYAKVYASENVFLIMEEVILACNIHCQYLYFHLCLSFQTLTPSLLIWVLYCGIVGLVFVVVKVMNYKLHHMFDTSEVIEEVEMKTSVKGDSNPAVALW